MKLPRPYLHGMLFMLGSMGLLFSFVSAIVAISSRNNNVIVLIFLIVNPIASWFMIWGNSPAVWAANMMQNVEFKSHPRPTHGR